jgi:hypothetical protein
MKTEAYREPRIRIAGESLLRPAVVLIIEAIVMVYVAMTIE